MTTISRQLTVNITAGDVWTQLKEGSGGAVYAVPTSGSITNRADIKMLRAINNASGSSQVQLAFSVNSTILADEIVWPRKDLLAYYQVDDDSVHVLRSQEGIWAKLINTSGSVNVTARASLLEVT